jgi:hypothetical protein
LDPAPDIAALNAATLNTAALNIPALNIPALDIAEQRGSDTAPPASVRLP